MKPFWISLFLVATLPPARAQSPGASTPAVFLHDHIDRPLRYAPDGHDFVITNGLEFFNRPLYGGHTAFRADGGDKPEFALYLPGRGGNLRLGIRTTGGAKWLSEAAQIVTRYRPGSLIHEIGDPLLGNGRLQFTSLGLTEAEGLVTRATWIGTDAPVQLCWAFGGVNGQRGRRDGDIGCESEPVGAFFQLRPEQCAGNRIAISSNSFRVQGRPGTIAGATDPGATLSVASATNWNRLASLLSTPDADAPQPVLVGRVDLFPGRPFHFVLRIGPTNPLSVEPDTAGREAARFNANPPAELSRLFEFEEKQRAAVAERVVVETPDSFINAAAAALNVAADAVWDEPRQSFMHGAVAWRVRLLGWRGLYAGDALGWHERTAAHFAGYARQQNTNPIPARLPPPDADSNLARSEAALHGDGDLTRSHYDMNLVGVDGFFRHLLWTGDLDYARRMWPAVTRHLAWERRLFRRQFGSGKLPLYEAYCCIWASDDLAYNGGGATHASAYNYYHNAMAARVARLIGQDPAPYEQEAGLIAEAMRRELWMQDRGWFAEWKDWVGLQLVHPNAAAWTFYHTVDSGLPTPLEAWQMTRFVDTQLARIPLRGPGVPEGGCTMPTTSWMPYSWSVNNVVLAEVMHTALAYWQAGRTDGAFPLFKGAVLDSMFLGLCPGNVGMCTGFDAHRGESQRDFADGAGAMSRALVEGLFGVRPDALTGELNLRPGFPAEWTHAAIRHPDFDFTFRREGMKETFVIEQRFHRRLALRLQIAAFRDNIAAVRVNGQAARGRTLPDSVDGPRVEIQSEEATRHEVLIEWTGRLLAAGLKAADASSVAPGAEVTARTETDALLSVEDPQGALRGVAIHGRGFSGQAAGLPGHRTVFARVRQGSMSWWQPITFEIRAGPEMAAPTDWRKPLPTTGRLETMDLGAIFNDRVTQIFRNDYLSPRSPFCSLAVPRQGIGTWCHPQDQFEVDDSGLRAAAAAAGGKILLPNGVPLATPGEPEAKNVAFVSQWHNYPRQIVVPLSGTSSRAYLLMAGSTSAMQSRFDNGEVLVDYTDGSAARLALHNPTTWWPIDRDYYIDDFAFARPQPLPPRVDLKTGRVRVLTFPDFKGRGSVVPGGAATVLELPLDSAKDLKSLTVRALANEVVIGLMSVTLVR